MSLNKEDKSFKILINKEFTTPSRAFYDELGADSVNISHREVWTSEVSSDPATAVTGGVAVQHTTFYLTADPVFSTKAFYFLSGVGFTPGTDSYNATYKQRNFISDKYGSGYEAVLYASDGTTVIPKNDTINWNFDYKTGILHIADPGAYSTPYRISVYRYTGTFLSASSVSGAASATDNAVTLFSGTGFKYTSRCGLLQVDI